MPLRILSAGAAQGVVRALAAEAGVEIEAQFGAVGAIEEQLASGAPCDLIVLTRRQIDALRCGGRLAAAADLGRVRTGVAVRAGDPLPAIGERAALAAAMRALAASGASGAIGCTQITEILYTPGVALAGALPQEFELATTYSAGLCLSEDGTRRFFELLTGDATAALRRAAGFEL